MLWVRVPPPELSATRRRRTCHREALRLLRRGRREVKQLTGSYWVPALVTDDGTVIHGSREIIDWAVANPATGAPATNAGHASARR